VIREVEGELVGLGLGFEWASGREEKWHEEAERHVCSFYSGLSKTRSVENGGALKVAGKGGPGRWPRPIGAQEEGVDTQGRLQLAGFTGDRIEGGWPPSCARAETRACPWPR
jgi:hypothetical protein